jgi:hypothetical protein
MISSTTRRLIVLATLLGGLLAGPGLDRTIVQVPGWRRLGAGSWAAFTRVADLGRGGVWYPAEGLCALFATIAAALAFRGEPNAPRAAAVPVYGAAALAVIALAVTAVVIVPDTRAVNDTLDGATLQRAFNETARWWMLKASLHVATFVANLWSLVVLMTPRLGSRVS